MNSAIKKSVLLHAVFLVPLLAMMLFRSRVNTSTFDTVEFQVIEKKIPKNQEVVKIDNQEINSVKQTQTQSNEQELPKEPVKKVFGLQKNTILDDSSEGGVAIKKGNTVLKEQDNEVAQNDEPLPVPKPEYMVTQMPVLLEEVIPKYPQAAKDKNFERSVAIKLLIDEQGLVRNAVVIDDPGMGLGQAALDAVKKYKFKPAKIADKNVAVEIRYYVEFKINT